MKKLKIIVWLSIILILSTAVFVKAQATYETHPCPIDTIKGIIYYQSTGSTQSEITEGYYIAACGGYQIGKFYGYDNVPTFIPAYSIRNDKMINGERQVNNYDKQKNSGYFTDIKFKKIPIDAVYGLLVIQAK